MFYEENGLVKINAIKIKNDFVIETEKKEVNAFFGEGIVAGSVVLMIGEPGVGKSTFLLYLTKIFKDNFKVFYFSGEESQNQIKKRCDRIGIKDLNLFVSNQIEVESILKLSKENKPNVIFIDSIQTCYSSKIESSRGTISQIKTSTSLLIKFAKQNSIPIFIVGHITKTGDIAGPKVLEHMVDVVIYFEGEFKHQYRILRSIKNRFGGIDEVLFFEMKEKGLKLIENPSGYFIEEAQDDSIIGRCRTVIIEGRRPIVIEIEALVVPSLYANSRRFAEGVENARISRIAAILEKHIGENLGSYDIYFNISGGVKTRDVGIDLAIAIAIYSSKNKKKLKNDIVFIGELSLTGKIRKVNQMERRIKEAKKYKNKIFILPCDNSIEKETELKNFDNIASAVDFVFK